MINNEAAFMESNVINLATERIKRRGLGDYNAALLRCKDRHPAGKAKENK